MISTLFTNPFNIAMNENTINSERPYNGPLVSGFAVLFIIIVILAAIVASLTSSAEPSVGAMILSVVGIVAIVLGMKGFVMLEPGESMVLIFFGRYSGTLRRVGFSWINPFMTKRKISLRLRNLDVEPIKVNDRVGNPVLIGLVLVLRVNDTYRAVFDIDSNTSLPSFVAIQSDAALREVAGRFAYDNETTSAHELTLRGGGEEINDLLEKALNERLAMAGIEVKEARLNYLAYAPEIAAVMLRRQQAAAIVSAREKIVEGAVGMVKLALDHIEKDQVCTLSAEARAAMVSNLMVVLCSDDAATPMVNTTA